MKVLANHQAVLSVMYLPSLNHQAAHLQIHQILYHLEVHHLKLVSVISLNLQLHKAVLVIVQIQHLHNQLLAAVAHQILLKLTLALNHLKPHLLRQIAVHLHHLFLKFLHQAPKHL